VTGFEWPSEKNGKVRVRIVSVAGLLDDGVAMEEEEKCVDKRGKPVERRVTVSRHTREIGKSGVRLRTYHCATHRN
jgi:hypothetical protein